MAVLIVVAATAALAALVTVTTLGAAAAAAAAGYRAQSEQASWLAQSAISQTVAALGSGALTQPPVGASLRVRNGVNVVTGAAVPVGVVAAPIVGWPPVVEAPLASGGIGRGALVTVSRVVGPDGEGRGLTGAGDPDALLDVLAEVWFRNARIATPARLLVTPTEVRRLH